ncbi:MAG: bifunctional phosphoribosylaminoimidazolecarboxamide formyltransferase/IMP cyclohydrolase PurH [Bacteroidetes bacterium HGW-Bacteroidetes-21]|nr:MAG: bifunctional phosphoribosylaminoimidazolecarboxamide formyltransferase/IMP cyclohydrolase PurH [Bacteroidetes bacterium HGW-Bacteroidetes-21]
MSDLKKIRAALISVYYKDGLDELLDILKKNEVILYSTGGTYDYICKAGHECRTVESLTGYPSVLGGRVKTLHPKVFGGILARRDDDGDIKQALSYDFPFFDLVVVDLYPFSETVKSKAADEEIIEKIDIGGISLIRAAAKNFKDVCIISSRKQYHSLCEILGANQGATSLEERKDFALKAFEVSSSYDTSIASWFGSTTFLPATEEKEVLRYGENPHQKGYFLGNMKEIFTQLSGKEISYNNILDIDAAIELTKEFEKPVVAIIKHNNACGMAVRENLSDAWKAALAGDPVSAFGGVIAINRPVDESLAQEIHSLFFEVIIAPEYSEKALEIFAQKKNRIILRLDHYPEKKMMYRTALNGMLAQDPDAHKLQPEEIHFVTDKKPTTQEMEDLMFANIAVKHTKSNAIVLVKDKQLLAGIGGQTSRVDALKQAIQKAKAFGFDLRGAVMASDAFFPFPDCVEIAHYEGITAVVQPGGSVKDNESINYCNNNGLSMILTGYRHFRH